jgi:hypothetical protein
MDYMEYNDINNKKNNFNRSKIKTNLRRFQSIPTKKLKRKIK